MASLGTTTAHRTAGAVLVPSDAMFFEDGVAYVYVVQDGKAVRTDVTIGLYTADQIAVTAGLTPGNEVITTWSSSLRDGVDVRQASAEEESAPAGSASQGESTDTSSAAASGEAEG